MSQRTTAEQLRLQLSRQAKLSGTTNALPVPIRFLPGLAIFVGQTIAKATHGRNVIEEKIVGVDDVTLLKGIDDQTAVKFAEPVMAGVRMMCVSCQADTRHSKASRQHPVFSGRLFSSPRWCVDDRGTILRTTWGDLI